MLISPVSLRHVNEEEAVSACFLTAANHSTTIPMGTSLRRKLMLSALGLSAVLVPALTIPWFGARRLPGTRSSTNLPAPYLFPPGFLWGTATAAYQIEDTQDDDWAAFERDVVAHHRVEHRAPGQAQPGHIHKLTDFSEEVRLKKTDFDARIEIFLFTFPQCPLSSLTPSRHYRSPEPLVEATSASWRFGQPCALFCRMLMC